MEVIGGLQAPVRSKLAQNAGADIAAKVCASAGIEVIATNPGIDKRPERTLRALSDSLKCRSQTCAVCRCHRSRR